MKKIAKKYNIFNMGKKELLYIILMILILTITLISLIKNVSIAREMEYYTYNDTFEILLNGIDEHYLSNTLTQNDAENNIVIKVGGVQVTPQSKQLSAERRTEQGIQYTLTLQGVPGTGELTVEVAKDTLMDEATNTNDLNISNPGIIMVGLPTVSISPSTVTMVAGAQKEFTVSASDGWTISSYKWYHNTTGTPGEGTEVGTSSSYTFAPTANMVGTHYISAVVECKNANGLTETITSSTAQVNVLNENESKIILTPNKTGWTNGQVKVTVEYGSLLTENRKAGFGNNLVANATEVIVTENGIVRAEAKDKDGNTVTASLQINNIDPTAPTVQISPNGGNYAKPTSGKATIKTKLTATDEGGSQLKTLQYAWSTDAGTAPNSGWTTFTNGQEISKTDCEVDEYFLWVKVTDNAGNETVTKSNAFAIGENAIQINPQKTEWTKNDVIVDIIYGNYLTGEKTVEVTGTAGTNYKDKTINSVTIITNGQTITVKAKDASGLNEVTKTLTIDNIDKGLPKIDSLTPSTTEPEKEKVILTGKATDTLSGINGYQFSTNPNLNEYSDGWTPINPTTGQITQTHTVTENGEYYFYVKDQAGNVTKQSIKVENIDKTAPTITVTPATNTVAKSTTVKITASEALHTSTAYQYQLSETNTTNPTGTWSNYTLGQDTAIGSGLTGTYYLCVKSVKDLAGNESGNTVFGPYVFDNKAPSITFNPKGNTTYSKTQTTQVTAADNGTAGVNTSALKYQWTQSTTAPTKASFSTTFENGKNITKSDGTGNNYYLWICAEDTLGNYAIEKSDVFYLDNTLPNKTAPELTATTGTITVTAKQTDDNSGVDTASIQYAIKLKTSSTWGTWQSSNTFTGLTHGVEYNVKTRVKDKATNGYQESEISTIKTTAITTPVIRVLDTGWTKGPVRVEIDYVQITGATNQYSTDGITWNTYTGQLSITANLTVYARTIASDNQSSEIAQEPIANIDKETPKPTLTNSSNGEWTKDKVTITLQSEEADSGIDRYEWYKDGKWTTDGLTTTNGVGTISFDTAMEQEIKFRAVDKVGNISEEVTTNVKIDRTAPVLSNITKVPNTEWTNQDVKLSWTITENDSGIEKVEYSTNGTSYTQLAQSQWNGITRSGARQETIYVRVIDKVGYVSEVKTVSVKIETTKPTVNYSPNGGTYVKPTTGNATIKSTITASDEGGSQVNTLQYAWTTNGQTAPTSGWTTVTSGTEVKKTDCTVNKYYLWTKVTDKAGNETVTSSNAFNVGNNTDTANKITLTPDETGWTKGPVIVTVQYGSNLTQNRKAGFGSASTANATSVSVTQNGTVYAQASDTVGNMVTATLGISNIDNDPPTATSFEIKNVSATGYDVYVYGVTDNNGSGVGKVEFSTWTTSNGKDDIVVANGTKQSDGTTWVYRVNTTDHAEAGAYNTEVYLYDALGNNKSIGTKQATISGVTATFNANGGTTPNPQTITKPYGVALGTLPTTTREGYTFKGWYTAASGGTKIETTTTMPASNVTYYAQWTANGYDLVKVSDNNLILNGNFDSYSQVANPGWDGSLNGVSGDSTKAYNVTSWGTGYNGGVKAPESGYHAHMKVFNNNNVFNFKTNEDYVNASTGLGANRWLGISQAITASKLTAGKTYTITMDVYRVSGTSYITSGLHYVTTDDTATYSFVNGKAQFSPTKTGEWQTISWSFTLSDKYSTAKSPKLYIYGYEGSKTGELFIDNVRLEESTVVEDKVFNTNYTSTELASITKEGHTFNGWYNNIDYTTQLSTSTAFNMQTAKFFKDSVTGDTKAFIYAKTTPNSYTVTYNYSENGGTSATKTSAGVTYGNSIDLSPTATKADWNFVGWNTNKDATTGLSSLTMGASNITLYAIYSKTLTATCYTYNNTSSTVSVTIYNKATEGQVALPTIANATVSGVTYTPRGWSTSDAANATISVASGGKVTLKANATYYASYNAEITATFYYCTLTTSNYTYSGAGQSSATAKATRYANYKGSLVHSNYTVPDAVTKSTGGAAAETYKGVATSPSSATLTTTYTTANTAYYAVYAEDLTFYYYNGSSHTSKKVQRRMLSNGSTYSSSLSENAPTPSTYNSAAWTSAWTYVSTDPSQTRDPLQTGVNSLYATYTKTITVTYSASGWSNVPSAGTGTLTYISKENSAVNTINANITISSTKPTRTGYTFSSWKDSAGNSYTPGTAYGFAANTTLNVNGTANIYKVTLYNGGAPTAGTEAYWYMYQTTKVIDGETIYYYKDAACTVPLKGYKIDLPAWPGSTFDGYYTGSRGTGTQYVNKDGYCINNLYNAVAENIDLYANWINYELKIDPNGGYRASDGNTGVITVIKQYGETEGISERKYDGYILTGYTMTNSNSGSTTDIGGATFTFDSSTKTGTFKQGSVPITLTAQWSKASYELKIDPNGGYRASDSSTEVITVTKQYKATENISERKRDGYTLTGYTMTNSTTGSTSNLGGATFTFNSSTKTGTFTQGYEPITLTAQWQANPNTPYKVVHQQMGPDGSTYTTVETENKTGTTGTQVTPAVKSYSGFTAPSTQTVTIAGNGTTTVTYKYTRIKYTFTLGSATGVTTTGSTATGSYYHGATITLKASANTGYSWGKWTSSNTNLVANTSTANTTFTMPIGNITMTPSASKIPYTVTLSKGTGISSVSGNGTYYYGDSVTINATVSTGYTWSKWSGTHSTTTQKYTFTMPASNVSDTANATANPNTPYKVVHQQMGPDGSTYTTVKTENKTGTTGTQVTPAVQSYSGFTAPSTQTVTIAGDGTTTVTYKYTRNKYTFTLGSATGVATTGSTATGSYYHGATITLKASANTGYSWGKWTSSNTNLVANTSTANTTFTMPIGNITMTPSASKTPYTVTLSKGTGISSVSGNGTYYYGDSVTINATVSTGYTWSKWSGTHSTTTQKYTFTMPASNVSDTANATANKYNVTYATYDLIYGRGNVSQTTSSYMKYSITNDVVTVTANRDDGYGFIPYRAYLVAGQTYLFSCDSSGAWHSGSDSVQAYLMLDGSTSVAYYHMEGNKNYQFTPSTTGEYWLRLDVNLSGKTHTFSNIRIAKKLSTVQVTYDSTYGTMPSVTVVGWFDDTYVNKPLQYKTDYGRDSQYISTDTVKITSDTVLYGYMTPVKITTNPSATTVVAGKIPVLENGSIVQKEVGNTATFKATATGSGTLTYQWYYNTSSSNTGGTAISGATSSTYSFTPTSGMNGRYYYCVVTSSLDGNTRKATTTAAKLTLQAPNYSTTKSSQTTYYHTLNTAFAGTTSGGGDTGGGTITVLNDVTDTSSASTSNTIKINTVGLDGIGKTINRGSAEIQSTGGTLTIAGNGTIDSDQSITVYGKGGNLVTSGGVYIRGYKYAIGTEKGKSGTMTLNGGYYHSEKLHAVLIRGNGAVTIDGAYCFTPVPNGHAVFVDTGSTATLNIKGKSRLGNGSISTYSDVADEQEPYTTLALYGTGAVTVEGSTWITGGPYASSGVMLGAATRFEIKGSSRIYNAGSGSCITVESAGTSVILGSSGGNAYFYNINNYVLHSESYNVSLTVNQGKFASKNRYKFYINGTTSHQSTASTSNRTIYYMNGYNVDPEPAGVSVTATGCYYYTVGV